MTRAARDHATSPLSSGPDRWNWRHGSARRTYGLDTHSFISTPAALFVNSASGNYHLKAGSPAAC